MLGHRIDLNPGLLPSASGRPIFSDFLAPTTSSPYWKNGITLLSCQDWKQTMSMISMTSDNDCIINSTGHLIRWLIALHEKEVKAHQISESTSDCSRSETPATWIHQMLFIKIHGLFPANLATLKRVRKKKKSWIHPFIQARTHFPFQVW